MNENRPYWNIRQQGRKADVYIYGDITPCPYGDAVSAKSIVDAISALEADRIHVHIDSCGGSVAEGWGIYNALLNHPAKIITHGDGFVASAALYPFLAGDERQASSVSAYFFHPVMSCCSGSAADLRAAADEVDKLTDIGITAFVERTGMERELVRQLMDNETWLTPQQALEYGLATVIVTQKSPATPGQSAKQSIFDKLTATRQEPEQKTLMQTLAASLSDFREE